MQSFLILVVSFLGFLQLPAQEAEIAFRIAEKDLIPEGIAFDPDSKSFFVSSIHKNKVIRINPDKRITDFIVSGHEGIGQVLGMKVSDGKLWVCSNTGEGNPQGQSMVHVFDITGRILSKKWILQSTGEIHLFNDLVIGSNGDVFISDSDYGAIYRVNNTLKNPELLIKDQRLNYANGITLTPNDEVIVNTFKGFFKINTITRELKALPFPNYYVIGIDGLSFYKQSLIGIQNITYPVCINQYNLNSSFDKIENAQVLVSNHPLFDTPTTGVVVDDWFYFIANSQMSNLDKDKIKDPAKLKEVLIMRIKLN
jgi:DNA-binding beta-propeller fold protein YncE